MKKAIIIIVSVLVLALGTCTCLYFFTDVFNFLKPASNNFSIQAKKLFGAKEENSYSDYLKSIEKLKAKDSSYKAEGNVSLNVSLPSKVLDYSTQSLINSSSVKWSGSYDANSKAVANNIGLSYKGSEMISLDTLLKGNTVSIGCSDLYDKKLTFDMSKYESFCKTNNIEVDQDQLKSIQDSLKLLQGQDSKNYSEMIYNLFYLTEDEYKALDKNYGDLLTTLIDKDKYTSKKNQKVSVGDDEIKTTAYSLTLSGNDAYNYLTKLTEKAKDDSTLKDLIIKKYKILKDYNNTYIQALDESSDNDVLPDLSNSDIEKFVDEFLKELEDSKDSFSELKKSLKFTIYSDKKQNPVKFEVAIVKDAKDDGKVIFTEDVEDGKNTYTIDVKELINTFSKSDDTDEDDEDYSTSSYTKSLKSSKTSSSNKLTSMADAISKIIIVDNYEKSNDSRKGEISVSAKTSSGKQDILSIKYEKVNSKSEFKNNISVSSPLLSSVSFDLVCNITGIDTDEQKTEFNISGKIPAGYSTYKFDLKSNGSITYGKSDIPELTESNSVDVFSKSKEDLQKIYTDVITNASNNLPSKLSKYGIRITKDDILSTLPQTPTTPEEAVPVEPAA